MLVAAALAQVMSPKEFFWVTLRFMFTALLVALAVWWCIQIAGRFRDDTHELTAPAPKVRKILIVVVWVVTLWIALWLVRLFWGMIVDSWRAWD